MKNIFIDVMLSAGPCVSQFWKDGEIMRCHCFMAFKIGLAVGVPLFFYLFGSILTKGRLTATLGLWEYIWLSHYWKCMLFSVGRFGEASAGRTDQVKRGTRSFHINSYFIFLLSYKLPKTLLTTTLLLFVITKWVA